MKVIVPVLDKYHYIIPVFCEMFNKYWKNQECVLLCNKKIKYKLDDNFTIYHAGADKGWGSNLRKYLLSNNFKDDYFVLHLEDHILFEYVKMERLKIMENEIINGAQKAMLHSHLNIYAKKTNVDNVLELNQDAPYRNSIHTAIWRTDYILSELKDSWSVWDFEITKDSLNNGAKIVSYFSENTYYDHIVDFMNLLRRGRVDPSIIGLWHEEDLETLLKIPFDDENKRILLNRTNNICPKCHNKVNRQLLQERKHVREYFETGTCFDCQVKGS